MFTPKNAPTPPAIISHPADPESLEYAHPSMQIATPTRRKTCSRGISLLFDIETAPVTADVVGRAARGCIHHLPCI
jgi:hypothetical protein